MDAEKRTERRQARNEKIRVLVDKAQKVCSLFFDEKYIYNNAEAVAEFGLDEELVEQLLEDYVIQIIKAVTQFEEMLYRLQADKDAELLLEDLMKKDDLEYLFLCIETLRASAIILKPKCAYNAIKLIEVKSTF